MELPIVLLCDQAQVQENVNTLDIEPFPFDRPRFNRGRGFNSSKYASKKLHLSFLLQKYRPKLIRSKTLELHPLKLKLVFHVKQSLRPKKHLKVFPCKTPDLDNYVKAFLDAANGVLFHDDCLVCEIHARKVFVVSKGKPRIEFAISELSESSLVDA